MSRSDDTRQRQVRATLWRIIMQRLMTLTMLAVAMEWATPIDTDVLLAPGSCAATAARCYEVRDTTPQAPSGGSGRTSSTSCTSM
jgi:hypothetical protein